MVLEDGRHVKAWPWLPRAPKLSPVYPWMATMFVPLSFPFPENIFLQSLKSKHNLDGSAGDLTVSDKISRSGKEGSFYRFGMDQAMKDSLQGKNFVLRFSIHRTTIFVAPNRLYPGHEHLPGPSLSLIHI